MQKHLITTMEAANPEKKESNDEFDCNLVDDYANNQFNKEAGEINKDVGNVIKGDAIGNTLYSKSWLLKFLLSLASTRCVMRSTKTSFAMRGTFGTWLTSRSRR